MWNLDKIKTSLASGSSMGKTTLDVQDCILAVLKEHENQIDCVRWANMEANRTIDQSEYNKGYL